MAKPRGVVAHRRRSNAHSRHAAQGGQRGSSWKVLDLSPRCGAWPVSQHPLGEPSDGGLRAITPDHRSRVQPDVILWLIRAHACGTESLSVNAL